MRARLSPRKLTSTRNCRNPIVMYKQDNLQWGYYSSGWPDAHGLQGKHINVSKLPGFELTEIEKARIHLLLPQVKPFRSPTKRVH